MTSSNQVCTFFLSNFMFGIDVQMIQEVIRFQEMTHVPLAPATVRGLINLRGQIVTAIDLRARLSLPPRTGDALPTNIIVRTPDGAVSLLVDEIGDVVELDASLCERPPATLDRAAQEVVTGVHQLNDRLLLILDVIKTTTLTAPVLDARNQPALQS